MSGPVRVGIVGAAWGVAAHLPAWRAVPGVEVVGICTAHEDTARAASEANGIPLAFWDAAEMARHPDIDLIDAGTRPSFRRDMCIAAFDAGKHVYTGIPFAASLEDALAICRSHQASARVGAVDAYSEYLAPFRFSKELVDDGVLGRIHSVIARLDLSLFAEPQSTFPYNWFADRSNGASAVNNLGSHLLHLVVHLFGPVAEVSGKADRFLEKWQFLDTGEVVTTEVEDTAAAALVLKNGALGQLHVSWSSAHAPGFLLEGAGDKGRIELRSPMMPSEEASIAVGRVGGGFERVEVPARLREDGPVSITPEYPGDPRRAMALSFAAMVSAIDGAGAPAPGLDRALHVQRVIEAVLRSGAERRWIDPATL